MNFNGNINDLLENLLPNIFSHLPSTVDVIKLRLVCPKWRNLWFSMPYLKFIQSLYPSRDSPIETTRSFVKFVNRALLLRSRFPLINFCLHFNFSDFRYTNDVNNWVRYAIDNHTKELELNFLVPAPQPNNNNNNNEDDVNIIVYYTFLFSMLMGGDVSILKLRYCVLWFPSEEKSRFSSLKSIVFNTVLLTEQMISNILIKCANLEDLTLDGVMGIQDLKICSKNLRKLSLMAFIYDQGSLEVICPKLESIRMISIDVGKYTFKDMGSLVEVELFEMLYLNWSRVVRKIGNVQHLLTGNEWFQCEPSKGVFSGNFMFDNLNFLEMTTGYSNSFLRCLAALFECAPNLDTMILNELTWLCVEESSEELMNISIDFSLPSLRQVKIRGFKNTYDEMHFISLLGKQRVVLEKIVLVPSKAVKVSLKSLEKLKLPKGLLQIVS